MAQGAEVGGREGIRGADTAGDDEFGAMESPNGASAGQAVSLPGVRALDASLQAAQLTQEQLMLMEAEVQRRLVPLQQQSRGIGSKIGIQGQQSCSGHRTSQQDPYTSRRMYLLRP